MSRLKIAIENQAVQTVERLYKDLERRIVASPPGICPVDLALNFLRLCHAQTCGKCVPCRIGLGQLASYLEDVLEGRATLETLGQIERLARDIEASADCAIGWEAARMVQLHAALRLERQESTLFATLHIRKAGDPA